MDLLQGGDHLAVEVSGVLWWQDVADPRWPDASSTPSASMCPAPSQPSSPGWNMKTTSPASWSRRSEQPNGT